MILAAGAATRFGAPKQALLLPAVLERVRAAGVAELVVVLGAYELDSDAPTVRCPDWERGPGASLRCGLRTLGETVEAAIVVLADGPELAPAAISRVVEAWRASDAPLVAASYGGIRGHPLLVARSEWTDIPDEGLRAREPLLVPCDDLGSPGDVDFPVRPSGTALLERRSFVSQRGELLEQARRHSLARGDADVAPELLFEAVPAPAVVAAVEVSLGHDDLVRRQIAVEVALQQLLASLATGVVGVMEFAPSSE